MRLELDRTNTWWLEGRIISTWEVSDEYEKLADALDHEKEINAALNDQMLEFEGKYRLKEMELQAELDALREVVKIASFVVPDRGLSVGEVDGWIADLQEALSNLDRVRGKRNV